MLFMLFLTPGAGLVDGSEIGGGDRTSTYHAPAFRMIFHLSFTSACFS